MASAATSTDAPRPIVRLWSDHVRYRQLNRFLGLRTRQFEESRAAGRLAWEQAVARRAQIPKEITSPSGIVRPSRLDIPTADVFALVLGVFRAGATLSEGRGEGKILALELSAQDIANLIGRSKSTVEAALRWLGCGPIEYHGVTYCHGLGWLHRRRRYGRAYLEGVLRWVFRTSSIVLTFLGRAALKLGLRSDERRRLRSQKLKRRSDPVRDAQASQRGHQVVSAPSSVRALSSKQAAIDDVLIEESPMSALAVAAREQIRNKLNLD